MPMNVTSPEDIRRVERVDLEMMAAWLVKRLQERHTEAGYGVIMGWLGGLLASNEYFFVRTARAVALAQVVRLPLEVQPEVHVRFCFCMAEEDEHEAADLYPRMASWAANLNASKIFLAGWSDITFKRAGARIGRNTQLKTPEHYVLLGRVV